MIVIDVSWYQRNYVLDRIPHSGLIARATTMDNNVDRSFYDYMNRSEPKGCYKYCYAHNANEAHIEAVALAQVCRGLKLDLGIWLDLEDEYHRVCSDRLLEEIITEYNTVLSNYGMILSGIYCDYDFYKNHINLLKNYPLWIAKWGDKKPDLNCVAWQYTNKYYGLNVDASYWFGYQHLEKDHEKVVEYNPDNVRQLQKYLNNHYKYNLTVDGKIGNKTFTAICQSLAL